MQYLLTPYSESRDPYVWWEGAFDEKELDLLQNQALNANQQARTGAEQSQYIRRSLIHWLEFNESTRWVYKRLAHVISMINAKYFRFDLTGFGEPLQLTNYDHSDNGTYGWHQDVVNQGVSRKLSLVLQLTDPSKYEGGNLQIMVENNNILDVRKQRGLIAVFPSYSLHQVTPINKGSRQSLVTWISGPSFR